MTALKTKPQRIEDQHQIAYLNWLKISYPYIFRLTARITNEGKRNQILGAQMGIKPGMPDLFMFYSCQNYHGLGIEMKRPFEKGKPKPVVTEAQKEMIELLNGRDYFVKICYGWEEAMELTKWYLGPNWKRKI